MKKCLIFLPAALCVLGFAACSNETADQTPEETTAAQTETTASTTVTTTTETTTVTTTTTPDYQIVKDVLLEADPLTARPTSCTFTLTNNTEERQPYTGNYRIYNAETGSLLGMRSGSEEAEANAKTRALAPGESAQIEADWTELYGTLEDGTYIFELELSREEIVEEAESDDSSEDDSSKDDSSKDDSSKDDSSKDDSSKDDSSKDDSSKDDSSKDDSSKDESSEEEPEEPKEPVIIRMVAQAEFEINSDGFVPRLVIAPESVKPEGCVLTIKNSPDAPRDYGMVYRLYDETNGQHMQLFRQLDTDAKIDKNYHMEPGQSITLTYKWGDFYGSLLEGDYAIEVDLLTEGEENAVPYRASFTITS